MEAPDDRVTLAARAATRLHRLCPRLEGEIFALWMADLLLALRLRWERPAPLLATKILDPVVRRGNGGARPQIDKLDAAILVGYKTSVDGSAEKARTPWIRL